jgi:hypothetical protein
VAENKDTDREALKAWLRHNLEARRVAPTKVARDLGIATTTLTKFLNDPKYKFTPSTPIVAQLERYFGQQAPRANFAGAPGGTPMLEGLPISQDGLIDGLAAALAALIGSRKSIQLWEIATHALEAAGYLPGDLVLVDPHVQPNDGDVVCAEVADPQTGARHPIFRLFQKPYLLTSALDRNLRIPLLVDDRAVIVRGVVTERLSRRRTTHSQ